MIMIEKFKFTMANLDLQTVRKTRITTTINSGISSETATEETVAEETEASEEEEVVFRTIIFDRMMMTVAITENRNMKIGRIEFTMDRITRRISIMEVHMKEIMKTKRSKTSP